jgi:hypothetical protein
MVKRSVRRQRRAVTAADLKSAQAQGKVKKRKARSLTRAAQARFVARANKRGLMKRAAERAGEALPHAPSKLEQLEARLKAGVVSDPLPPVMPGLDPGIHDESANRARASWIAGSSPAMTVEGLVVTVPSLTHRVRALYEEGVVPVREIARLCGVTERTLYKYAARGRWRKRYARRALHKGAGGRFILQEEAGKATAGGLKALDPVALAAAEIACGEAGTIANRAAARTLAEHEARTARETVLREFETSARRLAALVKILEYTGPESRGLTPWRGKSAP